MGMSTRLSLINADTGNGDNGEYVDAASKMTKSVRHFINLTNGIEVLPKLLKRGAPMENIR
jgi:hypothetical protein